MTKVLQILFWWILWSVSMLFAPRHIDTFLDWLCVINHKHLGFFGTKLKNQSMAKKGLLYVSY
jgi:hypothetical protein